VSAKAKKPSPVVSLVQSVWDNANSGKGHSWQILNGSLHQALMIAITAHYKFAPDDFKNVTTNFDGGYWMGTDGDGKNYGERYYAHAVACNNMSAAMSFEHWRGIEPYLFLGKRLSTGGWSGTNEVGLLVINDKAPGIAKAAGCKTDEQVLDLLSRDCKNKWWVTGFDNEFIRLACYYSDSNKGGHRTGTPKKRIKLTRDQLAEMSKAIRAAIKPEKKKKEVKS